MTITDSKQLLKEFLSPADIEINGDRPRDLQVKDDRAYQRILRYHNFGTDYDKTLMAWHENFENGWPEIADKYGQKFYRRCNYYLLISAGSFRSRSNQLWQIVLSKEGVSGGYKSIR